MGDLRSAGHLVSSNGGITFWAAVDFGKCSDTPALASGGAGAEPLPPSPPGDSVR